MFASPQPPKIRGSANATSSVQFEFHKDFVESCLSRALRNKSWQAGGSARGLSHDLPIVPNSAAGSRPEPSSRKRKESKHDVARSTKTKDLI